MEIALFLIILLTAGGLACTFRQNRRLKREIEDFVQQLDESLTQLLNGKELDSVPCEADDPGGRIYEKTVRISRMYARKNQEIYEEKENLKELISDISHQAKTPLANIKLYLELLSDGPASAADGETVKKMSGQADKLEFLLQSMVKMSRLETGIIKIRKKESPVSDALAAAIEAVAPKADEKNIRIHVEYDEDLLLAHDRKWTGEAIFNVLDNAVKYTQPGGAVFISVVKQELFTRIHIRDTGKGIPVERQGAVFTRFYREPEIHDSEGIGIGLYLAQKILSMQGGYIEVKSQVGKGSDFILSLPN